MNLRTPRRWYVYSAVITLIGLVAVMSAWPYYPVRAPLTVALFAVLGIATNLFLIPTSGTASISLSDAVFLAAAIVLGPSAGAFVIIVSVAAGALGRRPLPPRTLWRQRVSQMLSNYGMYMTMITAATWTYTRLGGRLPIDHLSTVNYLAAAAFIIVYQLLNRLILYTGIYLRGQSLRADLASEPETMPLEILDLHIGILIALAYVSNGWGPLVIFGIAILMISLVLRRRVSMAEQLKKQVAQLGALNEIGRAISANMDIPRLMEAIYRESSKVIDTSNFYIALYNAESDEVTFILDVQTGKVNTTPTVRRGGKGLTEYVIRTRAPLLLSDNVGQRARALGIEPVGRDAQCWLGVPMIAGEHVIGMIAAQNYDSPGVFTDEHVSILTTIAAQAAIAIENARLLEAVARQERLRQELALARKIQQSLLPDPPARPGLFIASRCLPAQETGGDLYDFIPIDEHHLGIAVGDVVGKGMPAALLMATARSALRAYAQHQLDPAAVLEAVNRVTYDDTHGKTFVSLCYCILDTYTWTLTFASAGHLSPLLCGEHQDPIYLDNASHLPLGSQADLKYVKLTRILLPGQAVLLYTDGVVEAQDEQMRMFGFEGLQSLVAHQPAQRLIDMIVERVTEFVGPVPLPDDLTLVVIQRME